MMEVMMAMKKMMMAVRLMVDFGPFLEDSATRKCGLKDHAVHFETLSWLRTDISIALKVAP